MTQTQTMTNGNGNGSQQPINLSVDPLRIRADERERWINFGKEGVSFDDAAQRIIEAAKEDGERSDLGIARLDSYAFGPAPDGTAALATIPAAGRERRLIPLRAHAFRQLCERSGAPSQYIRKLPAKLQMACVNHGMQKTAKQNGNLLRLAGDEGRALLSDRYAALDNHLILDVMRKTLVASGMLGDVMVRSIAVGPTCSLRMTFPEHAIVVKDSPRVGDVVEFGFDLLNGEVGNRSVSIAALIYQLICLNGMRRADKQHSTRLNHVGDPARLAEAFADAVPATFAAAQGLRGKMETAVDRLIDDVLGEFDALKAFGLSATDTRDVARDVFAERNVSLPEDTKEWGDAFASVASISAYDVLNGITHVAQRKGTDRRLEMEEAASSYLLRRTA
jgi:hypothetical protein